MATISTGRKIQTETIKTDCWFCDGKTNHKILFAKTVKSPKKTINDFNVVQCQGCDTISFLLVEKVKSKKGISANHYNYPDLYHHEVTEYDFLSYEDINKLPKRIARLYDEVRKLLTIALRFSQGWA